MTNKYTLINKHKLLIKGENSFEFIGREGEVIFLINFLNEKEKFVFLILDHLPIHMNILHQINECIKGFPVFPWTLMWICSITERAAIP